MRMTPCSILSRMERSLMLIPLAARVLEIAARRPGWFSIATVICRCNWKFICHHHALHDEFVRRNQFGITRILGAQSWLATLHHQSLQRAFAIDERCDDIA